MLWVSPGTTPPLSYRTAALGAMESVTSLLRKGERVLVASNGVFGDRWEGILSRYPVRYKFLRSEPGKAVSVQEIDRELQNGYDVFITTHVETSTGVRMPIEEVSKVVRDRVSLIVVDGVASVGGGEAVSAEDWKVDVFFTASQKAVGAQPGTSLMVCSGRAMERLGGGRAWHPSTWTSATGSP
ncbi:aminotransferase class V-fold PLP-dependent enzyme [Thermogymnomonas acidicola]|uniref:aminotransferase class V-fold PLP-dependent enzyme n=1 Tax=Thermogymnomonas acidicola TaxID=399579 RepID=UPI0014941C2C|nr:aminotransferase class V-fold PLP-dependent enzyme [Thermogymnomonas acidicola]